MYDRKYEEKYRNIIESEQNILWNVIQLTELKYTAKLQDWIYLENNYENSLKVIDEDKVVGMVTATDLVNQFAVSTEEDMKNMYYQSITKIFAQEHYV